MNTRFLGLLLACTCSVPSLATAAKVEADFNDLKLGDTRTKTNSSSPNDGNVNTGTGFAAASTTAADGGWGEYNNNTGVLAFERGDLPVPLGVTGFISQQEPAVDPAAAGQGVVFGSSTETSGTANEYRRFQERRLATSMTNTVWFSYLFRLDGPKGDARIIFNKPSTTNSSDTAPAAFSIAMGSKGYPGAIGIITDDTAMTPAGLVGNSSVLYYDDLDNNGSIDGTEIDLNGNGQIDGVDVGKGSASNISSHLIVGRITVNASGDDLIEIWLDPANIANLQTTAPTLTATDEVGTGGISSIAFEGTRHIAPSPTGGPYTDGGHSAIDHFRMSDDADGFDFITGNIIVDPKLGISATSPSANFNFRGVFGNGAPVTSAPITVILENTGVNNPITINSIAFQDTTDPTFALTNPPALPVTLTPGQKLNITMVASSSTFEAIQNNSLVIDTDADEQDMVLEASATFYNSGSRLNLNPGFESTLNEWISDNYGSNDTPAVRVSPGLFGTNGMVKLQGVDDTARGTDNLSQTLLNGAADWEFTFLFSPINESLFQDYIGSPMAAGDRTFQVVIQADGNIPTPATGTQGKFTEATNADAALVNLAYLPQSGGFCVFNGTSWISLGLPAITGSTDATKNGILSPTDPAGADTVNAYQVRIKGTGFGTPSAKYSVSVSQPNTTVINATAENLTIFSSAQGATNTPGAYTFTTGDISSSGMVSGNPVRTTTYWLDEVSFFAGLARDPDIAIGGTTIAASHNGILKPAMVTVTNLGAVNSLDIAAPTFGKPTAFESTVTSPIVIPPGGTTTVPVNLIPDYFNSVRTAEFTNMTLATNVTQQANHLVTIHGAGTSNSNFIPNWDFEFPGNDQWGDWDSFLFWDEYPSSTANLSKDVPGLLDGTGKGVHIANTAAIRNTFGGPASDFVLEAYFAVRSTSNRAFNMTVDATNDGLVNLRYQNNLWQAYNGAAWETVIDMSSNPLATSIDANNDIDLADAGDTKNVHLIRITGTGWNSATPTYQVEILDTAGNPVVASAPDLALFQGGTPAGGADMVSFRANSETNAGFWLDDVLVYSTVASEGVTITSISGGAGNFTVNWDSGGQPVTIERSTTLQEADWTPVSENNTSGPFTDSNAPNGRAFYRVRLANP